MIGFAQISSAAPLDEARDGFFRALADSGYIRDSTIKIIERNAQGDIATLMLIMNEFKQRGVGYVATISSIATQAALRVITSQPIVFGAVANPYIIGAGTSATEHKPHITGANIPLPLDSAFALAHEAFPRITTWGTLYDPSDPFAEFYLAMARHMATVLGSSSRSWRRPPGRHRAGIRPQGRRRRGHHADSERRSAAPSPRWSRPQGRRARRW